MLGSVFQRGLGIEHDPGQTENRKTTGPCCSLLSGESVACAYVFGCHIIADRVSESEYAREQSRQEFSEIGSESG